MHLFLLGVSHKTTPVDIREHLDFAARGLDAALAALGRLLDRKAGLRSAAA